MSWCGGGLISITPGVAWRRRAIISVTLKPGSWPPSPGLAPLGDLDLDLAALVQIFGGDAEPARGDLLDGELGLSPLGRGL
jgi:hypothetical protein